ncbi:MAG: hypothetical protein OXH96_02420, partial [Spirochaetaceae bacterium]|nr:hypothetical protein [Spirochaetaceae bacterium]
TALRAFRYFTIWKNETTLPVDLPLHPTNPARRAPGLWLRHADRASAALAASDRDDPHRAALLYGRHLHIGSGRYLSTR